MSIAPTSPPARPIAEMTSPIIPTLLSIRTRTVMLYEALGVFVYFIYGTIGHIGHIGHIELILYVLYVLYVLFYILESGAIGATDKRAQLRAPDTLPSDGHFAGAATPVSDRRKRPICALAFKSRAQS